MNPGSFLCGLLLVCLQPKTHVLVEIKHLVEQILVLEKKKKAVLNAETSPKVRNVPQKRKKKKSWSCHNISETPQKRGGSAQISLGEVKMKETPYSQAWTQP